MPSPTPTPIPLKYLRRVVQPPPGRRDPKADAVLTIVPGRGIECTYDTGEMVVRRTYGALLERDRVTVALTLKQLTRWTAAARGTDPEVIVGEPTATRGPLLTIRTSLGEWATVAAAEERWEPDVAPGDWEPIAQLSPAQVKAMNGPSGDTSHRHALDWIRYSPEHRAWWSTDSRPPMAPARSRNR